MNSDDKASVLEKKFKKFLAFKKGIREKREKRVRDNGATYKSKQGFDNQNDPLTVLKNLTTIRYPKKLIRTVNIVTSSVLSGPIDIDIISNYSPEFKRNPDKFSAVTLRVIEGDYKIAANVFSSGKINTIGSKTEKSSRKVLNMCVKIINRTYKMYETENFLRKRILLPGVTTRDIGFHIECLKFSDFNEISISLLSSLYENVSEIEEYLLKIKDKIYIHCINDVVVRNLVVSTKFGDYIDLYAVKASDELACTYNPKKFPGLNMKIPDLRPVISLFDTGNIVLPGCIKMDAIHIIVDYVFTKIHKFIKNPVDETYL